LSYIFQNWELHNWKAVSPGETWESLWIFSWIWSRVGAKQGTTQQKQENSVIVKCRVILKWVL